MLVSNVSALYVDPGGPYPDLVADWWDELRDAKRYPGPCPVVAHPPCGPWGRMRSLCTDQDPDCGPSAVQQVRQWGGVLEHPAGSLLWERFRLGSDAVGRTYAVDQVAWGHACLKRTWLYVVGVRDDVVRAGIRRGGEPTHQLRARHNGSASTEPYKMASKEIRRRTPPAFARWLVSLAGQVRR